MLTNMPRLPLQTLPAFRAVARAQNMRRAAEELHLTHSAISQQIKLLEEQVGVPLFDRRGRGLVLNAAGAALQRATETALDTLADGLRLALASSDGQSQALRLTVLPSFAQRWLLPRMGSWRDTRPDIPLEVHSSHQLVDLRREGFHAAIRPGNGRWRGLHAEPLASSPMIVVAAPQRAARLAGASAQQLAAEPLLGDAGQWGRWLALSGARQVAKPVAEFNDYGLMLQATEQDLGIALTRELLAADALHAGRLVRVHPMTMDEQEASTYWFVHPEELAGWPPLQALRHWLNDEMARSRQTLSSAAAG